MKKFLLALFFYSTLFAMQDAKVGIVHSGVALVSEERRYFTNLFKLVRMHQETYHENDRGFCVDQ